MCQHAADAGDPYRRNDVRLDRRPRDRPERRDRENRQGKEALAHKARLSELTVQQRALEESIIERHRVRVEDNGPGIVKEQIPKIFAKLLPLASPRPPQCRRRPARPLLHPRPPTPRVKNACA